MDNLSRSNFIDQRITRILRTPWSAPVAVFEGTGEAMFCDIVLELASGERFSIIYGDVDFYKDPAEELAPLEPELQPDRPLGVIKALAVDQWDALFLILHDGQYLHLDPGGPKGFAYRIEGGPIESLRSTDEGPRVFRDYWTGEPVDIYSLAGVSA